MTISPVVPGVKELICSRSEYLDRYTPKNICRHICHTHTQSNKITTYRIIFKVVPWLKSAPTNKFFEIRPVSCTILSLELKFRATSAEHVVFHSFTLCGYQCCSCIYFAKLCFSNHPEAAFLRAWNRLMAFHLSQWRKLIWHTSSLSYKLRHRMN